MELDRLEVRLGRSKAIVAIARKLLVAVWHILAKGEKERHADEQSVAASFINLAYRMGTKNLPDGINVRVFTRQQLDRLKISAGLKTIRRGSKQITLPPSQLKE
jgi:transposase